MTNEEKLSAFYCQLPIMISIGKIINNEKICKALIDDDKGTTIQVSITIQQNVLSELLKIVDSSVETINEAQNYTENHYPPHKQHVILSALLSYIVGIGLKTMFIEQESVVKHLIDTALSFEPTREETT